MNGTDTHVSKVSSHGKPPQSDDDLWVDSSDLTVQVLRTSLHFIRLWIAIARRTTLDDITNKYLFTVHANTGQQFLQKAAGSTHKGTTLFVFVEARTFSNEYQIGVGGTFAGDCMLARMM